jgi:threonine ammonia-lyase
MKHKKDVGGESMLTLDMVREAQEALRGIARRTPLDRAPKFGENVYIKAENLQLTGAFKLRGAYNKIRSLTPEEAARGVIACSAGNHAQGIALSASRLGIKAVICMPAGAPISKVEATRGYGAEVVLVPGVYDDAAAEAERLTKEQGYTFAHPFNDPLVIAGQGTIGLEILEQLPDVEQIVVPIGGGGLITGIALTMKTLKPSVKIYGVMPVGSAVYVESRRQGQLVTLDHCSSMADAVVRKTGEEYLYPYIEKYVDDIFTVTEDSIRQAVRTACLYGKLTLEGSGALALAALLEKKCPLSPGTVLICSGGNIDKAVLDLCMQA